MKEAVEYSHDRPILIDHFLEDAIEVDVDALSMVKTWWSAELCSTLRRPHSLRRFIVRAAAVDIPGPLLDRMRDYTFKLARALKVVG